MPKVIYSDRYGRKKDFVGRNIPSIVITTKFGKRAMIVRTAKRIESGIAQERSESTRA